MSYILDALKKAEAERKLGSVPDLNAQSIANISSEGKLAFWRKPLMWIVLAMLASALGTFLWLKLWQSAPTVVATVQVAEPVSKAPQNVAPTAAAPALPATPATEVTALAKVATPEPIKKKAESKEAVKAKEVAKAKERKPVPPAVASVAPPPPTTILQAAPVAVAPLPPAKTLPAPPVAVAPIPERLPTLRELPDSVQREIPPLAIGGYIFSSNQAERSILINNRLLREGELAAPGLILEKMMQKEAVFNYKGYRYRLAY